ncbi:Protein CBG18811 [Caenorhabditis briggsae]|uniref:Protein CBG18811 n=1 Tax=Caenorhabditis briggsae TaxID=6238 RepID=A8XU59_CAEBR|nr:Protein CBG18811 [Caenorhabditis briggsae]CAP36184.2 Protein CBG18811 [Caenorhabditis briggsae]
MAPSKVAKNKRKFTHSNRKSSQRSSSTGSKTAPSVLSNCSSRFSSSQSSKSSQNTQKSKKKDRKTFKTIYKASDSLDKPKEISNWTVSILAWLQGAICVYLICGIVFQVIWGKHDGLWWMLADILLFERMFGLSATCFFSSAFHFFIVIQSMRFVGESKKRKDFSDKVIVEGIEKRRRDLKVNLTIRDETGNVKSMRGAGVEAGVNRVLEMNTDGERIHLSTSNTTLTRINVPKHKNHHHGHHQKSMKKSENPLAPIINSKYNNCSKQEKMLSPRKILG